MAKQASDGPLRGILSCPEDQIISWDYNSDTHSSTLDAGAGIALSGHFVKLISLSITMNLATVTRWWMDFMVHTASKK